MTQMVPGIRGFPLDIATILRGNNLTAAERTIGNIIEPRRLAYAERPAVSAIRISHVAMPLSHLFGVRHGAPLRVASDPIHSFQVMVPLRGRLCKQSAQVQTIVEAGAGLIYSPGDRMDTYWSADCVALVLSISAEKMSSFLRKAYPAQEYRALRFPGRVPLDSGAGRSFATVLGAICRDCTDETSGLRQGITARALEEALLLSLLLAQEPEIPELTRPISPARQVHIARAIEFIDAHCQDEISVVDLAQVAGVSARTLQLGFIERFGVGPMTYVKQIRLRHVHDELLRAVTGQDTVGDLAAKWGFYNGSAFAKAYKQYFGTLPSETLGRQPRI